MPTVGLLYPTALYVVPNAPALDQDEIVVPDPDDANALASKFKMGVIAEEPYALLSFSVPVEGNPAARLYIDENLTGFAN